MNKSLYRKSFLTRVLCAALIFTFLMPAAEAQRSRAAAKKTAGAANEQSASNSTAGRDAGGKCDGWRGKITYFEKKQDERFKSKGQSGWEKFKMESVKSGEMALTGGTRGQATMMLESKEEIEEETRQKGCCWVNLAGCQKEATTVRRYHVVTQNIAKGEETSSPQIRVEGNRYRIELTLPAMRGKMIFKTAGSLEGSCDPKNDESQSSENENPDITHRFTPVSVEGTIDPNKPDTLEGSFQPDADTMIRWSLVRAKGDCDDGDLSVAGLKFEHHKFPNKTLWSPVEENTVDGNQVRITATVSNSSKKSKSGTVVFKETKSGEILGEASVSVPPEGEQQASIVWDTEGFAWTDAGENASDREIEARLTNGESAEESIAVYPKPVILVHGLWSNAAAWSDYQSYLNEAHSFAWKGFAVGADTKIAKMNTGNSAGNAEPTFSIRQNADELAKQIRHTRTAENAWRVDIVAHSMGGLISRHYIHNTMTADAPAGRSAVAHLVMLGTPNMGSPCADVMYPAYKLAGFEVEALRQLQTSVAAEFNQSVTNRKGVKFSILAGVPLPRTCQEKIWGDGVVAIPSALWQVADRSFAPRVHTAITGREDFFAFVKPRLAIGPKKARETAKSDQRNNAESYAADFRIGENWLASRDPLASLQNASFTPNDYRVVSSKSVKIAPGGRAEIPVGFQTAASGVTIAAPPSVTVSLVDADGEAVRTIEAGSADAAETFKTFYAEKSGNFSLRLENTGETTANALAAVWTGETNPLTLEFTELQIQTDGSLKLQAKLTNGEAPVKGAVVSVKINQSAQFTLFDDGKHGDEAANDGIYGATSEKLSGSEFFIEAKASVDGATATVNAVLNKSPEIIRSISGI